MYSSILVFGKPCLLGFLLPFCRTILGEIQAGLLLRRTKPLGGIINIRESTNKWFLGDVVGACASKVSMYKLETNRLSIRDPHDHDI